MQSTSDIMPRSSSAVGDGCYARVLRGRGSPRRRGSCGRRRADLLENPEPARVSGFVKKYQQQPEHLKFDHRL